jgi:hypothetical protein
MSSDVALSNQSIASTQVHDTSEGRTIQGLNGWTVGDVVNWLKDEEFEKDVCDKFASASFSFSFQHSKATYAIHSKSCER